MKYSIQCNNCGEKFKDSEEFAIDALGFMVHREPCLVTSPFMQSLVKAIGAENTKAIQSYIDEFGFDYDILSVTLWQELLKKKLGIVVIAPTTIEVIVADNKEELTRLAQEALEKYEGSSLMFYQEHRKLLPIEDWFYKMELFIAKKNALNAYKE